MSYTCDLAGPKSPKNPDVFLAPLMDELQQLWGGVETVDASTPAENSTGGDQMHRGRTFKMRGMVVWTIHDGPGLGSCSGLKVSGYGACHVCGPGMRGRRAKRLSKIVYHEHRRFLDENDPMRRNRRDWPHVEKRGRPTGCTPEQWRARYDKVERGTSTCKKEGINRWSIFYDLPYWAVSTLQSASPRPPVHLDACMASHFICHC